MELILPVLQNRKQCLLEALVRDPALLYHTDSHSVYVEDRDCK